jgi:hypothetical protein
MKYILFLFLFVMVVSCAVNESGEIEVRHENDYKINSLYLKSGDFVIHKLNGDTLLFLDNSIVGYRFRKKNYKILYLNLCEIKKIN